LAIIKMNNLLTQLSNNYSQSWDGQIQTLCCVW